MLDSVKTADLGPKQIAWLKANVPHFATLKKQADDAIAHSASIAARLESGAIVQVRESEAEIGQ